MAELMYFVKSMVVKHRDTSGRIACTPDAIPKLLKPGLQTMERLTAPRKVKPYFDSESYHTSAPSSERVADLSLAFLAGVRKVFATQPGPDPFILMAQRHGWVRHKRSGEQRYKVSFRAWVVNYNINYPHLKDAIIAAGCSALFDLGVYKSSEQLLGCILCTKTNDDPRVLLPCDQNIPLLNYIVQHLTGEEAPFILCNSCPSVNGAAEAPIAAEAVQASAEVAREQLVRDHPINKLASIVSHEATLKYLHLLGKHRWDDRSQWRDIATILKDCYGEDFKDEWLKLSQVSPKFDAEAAEVLWASVAKPNYAGRKLTMGTLIAWAKQDDSLGSQAVRCADLPPAFLELYRKGDYGLAKIAVALLADRVKRCNKDKRFYVFDREHCVWKRGDRDLAITPVSEALQGLLTDIRAHYEVKAAQAKELKEEAAEKVFRENVADASKLLARVRSCLGVSSVLTMAAPAFHDDAFEVTLDSVPHLLGVLNGVVDLRTGELRDRQPEDAIFTILQVIYDPDASTAFMDDLVLSIMAGNQDKAKFMQLLLGYGITAEVCEEVFIVLTGSGRNGKGVITQMLMELLGTRFFVIVNNAVITHRKAANLDAERGVLFGARIANWKELEPGERLKTSEVQLVSGGDGIPATPKYKDPMVIQPRFLCLLETNHMPELDQVIPAIMHRLLCIHFPVTFTDLEPGEQPSELRRQCDTGLKARLRGQKAGFLRWLVQGAVRWYATRDLKRMAPAEVKEFTDNYFKEQDIILQFFNECCERGPNFKAGTTELLNAFNYWGSDKNLPNWQNKQLVAAMRNKGFEKKSIRLSGSSPVQGYEGLRLLPLQG